MSAKPLLPLAAALLVSLLPAAALAQRAAPASPGAAAPIEVSVTGEGFVPSSIHVKKGAPVRLLVTRKTDRTCATEIVIKDLGISRKLPLNQPVLVEFTPRKAGTLRYACGMDMISGVLVVE